MIARQLGAEQLGLYAIGSSVTALFAATIATGCATAVARGVAQADERGDERRVIGHIILASAAAFAAGLVALLVMWLGAPAISNVTSGSDDAVEVVRAFARIVPVTSLGTVLVAAARTLRGVAIDAAARVAEALIRVLAVPALVLYAAGVVDVAILQLVGNVAVILIASFVVARAIRWERPLFELGEFVDLSGWVAVFSSVTALARRADVLVVSAFLGAEAAGVYRLVLLVGSLAELPLAAIQPMFLPASARYHVSGGPLVALDHYRRVTRFGLFTAAPYLFVCVVFPTTVLGLFGPAFQQGSVALVVLSIAYAIDIAAGPAGSFLAMAGGARQVAFASVPALVIELALLALLVPTIAIVGAGVATTASFFVINAMVLRRVASVIGVEPIDAAAARSFAIAGALLMTGIALGAVLAALFATRIAIALAVLVAYAWVVIRYGLPDTDRHLLARLVFGKGRARGSNG